MEIYQPNVRLREDHDDATFDLPLVTDQRLPENRPEPHITCRRACASGICHPGFNMVVVIRAATKIKWSSVKSLPPLLECFVAHVLLHARQRCIDRLAGDPLVSKRVWYARGNAQLLSRTAVIEPYCTVDHSLNKPSCSGISFVIGLR